jgi:hypothetical protein
MKLPALALAVLVLPLFGGGLQAQTMLPEACQPLTDANRDACCSALNWRAIILPEAQGSCDRGDDQNVQQQPVDDAVGSVTTPSDTDGDTTGGTPSTDTTAGGNPGNDEGVGNAGEKGMNDESPSTGTEGNSN